MISFELKPPQSFQQGGPMRLDMPPANGPKPPHHDPSRGYPEGMQGMNSAFAAGGGMGGGGYNPYGMEFGGYGMGMAPGSMYGPPYGGYPPQEGMGMPGGMDGSNPYARGAMYGQQMGMMHGGAFQGGMMGYGGGGGGEGYPPPQHPMDQHQQGMYGGYGGQPGGWGGQ